MRLLIYLKSKTEGFGPPFFVAMGTTNLSKGALLASNTRAFVGLNLVTELARMNDITTEASARASADTNLQNQVNSLNSSVSNGKTQVANAITGKGVAASGPDSFATLASKISQIQVSTPGAQAITGMVRANTGDSHPSGQLTIISGPTRLYFSNGKSYPLTTSSEYSSPYDAGVLGLIFSGPYYNYRVGASSFSYDFNTGKAYPTKYESNTISLDISGNIVTLVMTLGDNLSDAYWGPDRTDQGQRTITMRWDNPWMAFKLSLTEDYIVVAQFA